MGKRKPDQRQPRVTIEGEVLRQIRQHARSNNKTEVCGVLIGEETGNGMNITARIPGLNAAQAGTYVTFTQDPWEHIYKIKDKDFPDDRIVGWYHSHPGFGVFLSDHDTFIHKNFFSSAMQVAWVYDPHSDEEGCFGWAGERIERFSEIHVKDDKGGEEAGETGKPEPVGGIEDEEDPESDRENHDVGPPVWLKWLLTIASHLLLAAIAFVVALLFFPQQLIFFVDVLNRTVVQAPPGTHISRDGHLVLPKSPDFPPMLGDPATRPDQPDLFKPNTANPLKIGPETKNPETAKPDAKKPDGGPNNNSGNGSNNRKDPNVPRK
jgi:proteasome lid subunit RPN8/RPN11